MLFKKQICNQCGTEYEALEKCCPHCGQQNNNLTKHAVGNGVIATPFIYEILSMILGILGVSFVSTLFVLAALSFEGRPLDTLSSDYNNIELYLSLYSGYFLIVFGFIFIIVKNWHAFSIKLKKSMPYIWGFLLGVVIILSQFLYNLLLQGLKVEIQPNINEEILDKGILIFPISSIIVFGIIGPICEELTFRYGMFSFLTRINRVLAYALTILVFALLHMGFSYLENGNIDSFLNELLNLPFYLISGAILTFAYDKFGIQSSALAHIVSNTFAIIAVLIGI
ncbi:MAG: CPBP family intramembrane metalloprotease [Bacilli bacterium]|nr:CPBP family intramembrane metalloprotease [Bacilli bacterium]